MANPTWKPKHWQECLLQLGFSFKIFILQNLSESMNKFFKMPEIVIFDNVALIFFKQTSNNNGQLQTPPQKFRLLNTEINLFRASHKLLLGQISWVKMLLSNSTGKAVLLDVVQLLPVPHFPHNPYLKKECGSLFEKYSILLAITMMDTFEIIYWKILNDNLINYAPG